MDNLTYEQISFVAKYFDGKNRSDIPTSVTLGGHTFKLPVVPANMKCVIDMELAEKLAYNGYFYVMHRFYSYDEIHFWVGEMNKKNLITSVSVGVGEKDRQFLESIHMSNFKLDYITIDIAHGHCRMMKEMLKFITDLFPNPPFIIAGNVMTHQAVHDLRTWGANCVKVGIGPGAACFLGDTLVRTDNGVKHIKDVEIGEKVLTHTGDYKNVVDRHQKFSDELLEVNGEICTMDHQFYVIYKKDAPLVVDENIEQYAFWLSADLITDEHLLINIDPDQYQN